MALPGENFWPGIDPSRIRRFAAVLAALLLASAPAFADAPAVLTTLSPTEGPDLTDDAEGPAAVLSAVQRRDTLPSGTATASPTVVAPSPPRASLARPAAADPFGNGLGLRLRC